LLAHLTKELQMLEMKNEIQSKVRTEVDRSSASTSCTSR
jgi:hypothetical protein